MEKKIEHLAIILDGNRRWARENGLTSLEGHKAGYDKVKEVLRWCREVGIGTLTLYAFSTENWKRSQEEVQYLMDLFYLVFSKEIKILHKENVRVRVIGHKSGLSKRLQGAIEKIEKLTENNTNGNLNIALNYGGRQELVDAFNNLRINFKGEITQAAIANALYTANQPDPDLIIRTSGEQRLSGFLLWQGAYSELLFVKHHWPAFSRDDFNSAISEFENRQRRYGA
jgi:undecaprenyl diphosphate synthase